MSNELIMSVSGTRGIVGENLTPPLCAEYAAAFGTFLKSQDTGSKLSVCIGRDSRPSGKMIASAIIAGLCSVGIDAIDLGIVSTPGVGLMISHLSCAGGMVITASHNPIEYNGVKLLLSNGVAPPVDMAAKIKERFQDKKIDYVDSLNCGKLLENDQTDQVHLDKVLATVDKKMITKKNFKVVLDSVNGAGGRVGKKLLEELGCEYIAMNNEPTGLFAHTPEPIKENLTDLCQETANTNSHIGFAQDPDADRVAIVDENGTYIGEEYSLALAAKYIFSKGLTKKAAANLSTSRMIDDIAQAAGGEVVRTAVGEANVAEGMMKYDCLIGGEGNGGIIDLRVSPVRDSLVGMALVLQLMAETNKTVSQLVAEIGNYCMEKIKLDATKAQAQAIAQEAKKVFPNAKIDATDGVRFDLDDGWVHIRSSNTEPVMRIIVETQTEAATKKYIDMVSKIRKRLLA